MNDSVALNYKRAIILCILAYVTVTVTAVLFTYLVAAILDVDFAADVHNRAVVVAERFFPLINLLALLFSSWMYFGKRTDFQKWPKEAVGVGALWLIFALVVDPLLFVFIKTPYSLSPYDFYIGLSLWLYIIYLVWFVSPLCYVYLVKCLRRTSSQDGDPVTGGGQWPESDGRIDSYESAMIREQ